MTNTLTQIYQFAKKKQEPLLMCMSKKMARLEEASAKGRVGQFQLTFCRACNLHSKIDGQILVETPPGRPEDTRYKGDVASK